MIIIAVVLRARCLHCAMDFSDDNTEEDDVFWRDEMGGLQRELGITGLVLGPQALPKLWGLCRWRHVAQRLMARESRRAREDAAAQFAAAASSQAPQPPAAVPANPAPSQANVFRAVAPAAVAWAPRTGRRGLKAPESRGAREDAAAQFAAAASSQAPEPPALHRAA